MTTVQASGLRRCDIIMKGGITSGIVYPPAVRVLADHFRFVNIGGTSAGAIAASLTAAAEYRRQTGGGMAGFDRLAKIPEELAQNGKLFGLFRPNGRTRPLFDTILALSASRSAGAALLRLMLGTFSGPAKSWAYSALAVGIVAAALLVLLDHAPATIAGALAVVVLGALIGAGLALWKTAAYAQSVFVQNGYGLSSGVDESQPDDGNVLSVWLGNMLDEVAGLPAGEHLTFGHLWYGRTPTPDDDPHRPTAVDPLINLEVVSTCLSHGRPYTFPTSSNPFYFKPDVLKRYVHADIVTAMEKNARPPSKDGYSAKALLPYVRMPVDRDLPVVLAARMSLAFPGLLSAVELGAAAYGEITTPGPRPKPEPCWFADGGLSSNFPIHMFDSPLPRWPTVGINLGTFTDDDEKEYKKNLPTPDEARYVAMASVNHAGWQEVWSRFSGVKEYVGGAMLSAIKDWHDNVQMKVPGFRDRIVTIKLRKSEGGLNLNMGEDKIKPLVERGRAAGQMLVARFAQPSTGSFTTPMDWDNHRWVRYRVFAATAEAYLQRLARGYSERQPGDVSYDELLRLAETRKDGPYAWNGVGTTRRARRLTRTAAASARWLRRNDIAFGDRAPQPQPDLSKRARF